MKRYIVVVAAAGLLLAGCSGGDDDAKSGATKASTSKAAKPVPKLSTKWVPKLTAATDKGEEGVCTEVGSPECVKHITGLTDLVYDVETAIEDAGAEAAYPKSMAHIDKIEEASEAYVDAECKDSGETTLGDSACAGYVATLLTGPGGLSMTLETDELSR